jgi:outer membrane protein OmpA-like peptidoglycan-associated protein
MLFSLCALAQKSRNLVPNPSFEIRKNKSNTITNAIPWKNVGTVDFFMKPEKRDSSKFRGAHTGNCYAGLRFQAQYKEFMYVPLIEPLERGQTYRFKMFARMLSLSTVSLRQLGVYFSDDVYNPKMQFDKDGLVDSAYKKGISGTLDWIPIQGEYIAKGGERYIIIGNFNPMKEDMVRQNKWNIFEFKEAYYYIDDVSLKKKISKPDSLAAYKYAIENKLPDLPDTIYLGQLISIDNIQFETQTAIIKKDSYKILDEVVMFCNYHPFAQIQIAVYAENNGNEAKDKALAKQKAKSIFDYFKMKEVLNPLTFVGTNETKNNKDMPAENKTKNSRVTFAITSIE